MPVDTNILVFKQIWEKLWSGKTLCQAVESGFFWAFSSSLDSDATAPFACAALFWFGAGLVKGFALTLTISVAIGMFTALTCNRTLPFFAIGFPQIRQQGCFLPSGSTTIVSSATEAS